MPHLRWKIRILAHNASGDEENHEAGREHGLYVALAETKRFREVRDDAGVGKPIHAVLGCAENRAQLGLERSATGL